MKKRKYLSNIRMALLCFCTVLMFSLNFQIPEVGESSGIIHDIFENIRMSLNTSSFQMTIMVCAFYYISVKINEQIKEKPTKIIILNVVIAAVWLMSESFRIDNTMSYLFCTAGQTVKSIIYVIGAVHILNCLAYLFFYLLTADNKEAIVLKNNNRIKDFCNRHFYLTLFICMLGVWLPHTIISHPASIEYDVWDCVMQYYGDLTITAHHPPVYTVFIGWFTKLGRYLGDINIGLFIYVIAQTVVASLIMAYALFTMKKMKAPEWLLWGTFLIVAISPYYTSYVTTIIKDTPYAFAYLLFMIELLHLQFEKDTFFTSARHIFLLFVSVLVMTLFRYNGKYIVISSMLCFLLLFIIKKRDQKYLLKISAFLVVIMLISSGVSEFAIKHYNVLEQEKESVREALSLPFQQTARYVNQYSDELTEEEMQCIDEVLPYEGLAESYNPMISDSVKARFKATATYEEILDYFKVWFRCFLKHPLVYIEATLNQNYYVLYPMKENLRVYDSAYVDYFWDTEYLDKIGISKYMTFESANNSRVSSYKLLSMLPLSGMFSCLAIYDIGLLFLISFAFYKKLWRFMWIVVPEIVCVLIIIAGPVIYENIRYALPLVYSIPLVVAYFIYEYQNTIKNLR